MQDIVSIAAQQDVIASLSGQSVIAAQAAQDIVIGSADDDVLQTVSRAVETCEALQEEVFDIGAERVGDRAGD